MDNSSLPTFKNLQELFAQMSDERDCRKYFEHMRWGDNITCPHCSKGKPYRLKDGKAFRCSNRECRKDFSVTVGTIFENSKIPLKIWLGALYLLTAHRKGISSHQLARDLGITQKSAWFVLQRIRHIMVDATPVLLDQVVEVDETYVGGKFANMNARRRKKWQHRGEDNKVAVMGIV